MQLQQLGYFVAVAETRHFTRAAAGLGVAQPSLSQQIKALEDELGERLFLRSPGNVGLTAAGETLLPIARRILADAETVRSEIHDLGQLRRGRVRLGATPSLCTGLLPPILAAFREKYPGIQLLIHESGSRDLERSLSQGGLDLALVTTTSQNLTLTHQTLTATALLHEELVVVSPVDHARPVTRRVMTVAELQGHALVMFREGYDLREFTVAACRDAGFEPEFAIEGGEMDAVLGFVTAGLGIAVVPSTVVGDRFRVTPFTAPGLRRTISLASRQDVVLPRAGAALQEAIMNYLATAETSRTLPAGTRRA